MTAKTLIIKMSDILEEFDTKSLEIDTMEDWDSKMTLELILLYTANTFNKSKRFDVKRIVINIITRIGVDVLQRSSEPEKIIAFLGHMVLRIQDRLRSLRLENSDVIFNSWLSKDMVVTYLDTNVKKL